MTLTVKNLAYRRQRQVLFKNINFSIVPGALLQIAGQNGSGKTTLLRLLCGLLEPWEGKVLWQGENITNCDLDYQSQLNYIGHQSGLKDDLTAQENLEFYVSCHTTQPLCSIENALTKAGMQQYQHVLLRRLSAGQKRRVALSKLLLLDTPLWILDEPLTALDREGVTRVQYWIEEHVQGGGTVILTSHQALDWSEISAQCINLDAIS